MSTSTDRPRRPDESFLDLYLDYTHLQESPEMFHLWCGLSLLSVALGRKCFINRGYYRLYPNLFTILVAGSAKCRKSTSILIGTQLLNDLIEQGKVRVISGKITPEKFIDELTQAPAEDGTKAFRSPDVLVISSELSVMLTKQSYGEPLIHILTDLFDCPDRWSYKTRNRGEVHLTDVYLSILGATTPTGVAHGIPPAALQEGFASRVIFCYQEDTDRRNPFPTLTTKEVRLWATLKQMLMERSDLDGEFTLTGDAITWYTQWYNKHMEANAQDFRMDGMYGRKHDHILRLGMLFAGSYNQKIVTQGHLEASLAAFNKIEAGLPAVFAEMGADATTVHLSRLKSLMRHNKVMIHSTILTKMYPVSAFVLKELLETAFQSGWLVRDKDRANVYIWTG
jgi:hypothetical protein